MGSSFLQGSVFYLDSHIPGYRLIFMDTKRKIFFLTQKPIKGQALARNCHSKRAIFFISVTVNMLFFQLFIFIIII